jgi:ribosomal protein L37AE/L43A
MTAAAWLEAIIRRGGTCRLDEGRRVWVSPRTALTPALREAFPSVKAAIVGRLRARTSTVPAEWYATYYREHRHRAAGRCPRCGAAGGRSGSGVWHCLYCGAVPCLDCAEREPGEEG